MGIARGPNIITEDLVFGYDTGHGIANNNTATRFYPGQPSVNLFGDISNANARPNRTEYNTSAWTANFPKPPEDVGRVYSHTSGSLSSSWSGNSYGYTLISYSYLANTTYTLSCWVYVSIDCNITALHQSMEGTTLTNSTNRWYDLNNKGTWQQISLRCNSSSAVNGNAIIAYPSRTGVTDGSHTGFWAIGGAKLETNDHVTPYILGTRSETASLIDLKRNINIDVSNVSFDSTGQPEFDGTDDYLQLNAKFLPALGAFTMEFLFQISTTGGRGGMFERNPSSPYNGGLIGQGGSGSWYFQVSNGSQSLTIDDMGYPSSNTWYHDVGVYDGVNTIKFYRNGSLHDTVTGSNIGNIDSAGSRDNMRFMKRDSNSSVIGGKVAISKVYNKALSDIEVKQNYNAYKNRFNI